MAGYPIVKVASGGLPVTYSSDGNGWPVEDAASGLPVTVVASGGYPVSEGVGGFAPFNAAVVSMDILGAGLATLDDSAGVQNGGTLTVDGKELGSYDYIVKVGNQTISAFVAADWFSATADSKSAVIVVVGDLTINVGQTLTPAVRKLFTLLYVTGTLTVNGAISMSARGANHSASGSNITAQDILIISGTHGAVVDPKVPAAGGTGGASVSGANANGNTGNAGSAGGTGGGGSGSVGGVGTTGVGATGTSFSGGPASGGAAGGTQATSLAGGANGGPGSAGDYTTGATNGASGGAGNPGGVGEGTGANPAVDNKAGDGTGGTLIVVCVAIAGSGSITAAGANGGVATETFARGGGGSGGGSVTVLYGSDTSSITPAAPGGTGGQRLIPAAGSNGGNGGVGTARKLARAV